MSVSRTVPRLLGGLAALLAPWLLFKMPEDWPEGAVAVVAPLVVSAWWLAACASLVLVRRVRLACASLALLSALPFFTTDSYGSPFSLIIWLSVIIVVTHGRPWERAVLLRVCVSSVYAFTAMAKLNPTFLAGDQLVHIANTRPHMATFEPLFASGWGVTLSVAAVGVEAWLAVGLWLRRTRVATAWLGAAAHVVFTVIASSSWIGLAYLVPLNALLVVGYIAFFDRPAREEDEPADGAALAPLS